MASPDSQTPAADTPVRAFHWTLKTQGVIAPDERLPWPQMVAMGLQHVVAMFGATVLAPLLMGFDPNIAILMSGVGTLLFFLVVRGRVPSYLGSSFAFISVVIAATGYDVFKHYELFTLQDIGLIAVGFIAAFLAGFLAIKSLLKFVSSKNYVPFAYYRIVFGGLILLTSHMGWVKWTA